MKTTRRNGKAAFTLIELMAVITIVFLLAVMVVGAMAFVREKQAESKAKVQLALISKALEDYKMDMGQYPPTQDSADGSGQSEILYTALFREGYDTKPTDAAAAPTSTSTPAKATRIYLPQLDPTTSKQGWVTPLTGPAAEPPDTAEVKDPWGHPYRYRSAKALDGTPNLSTQNPDFDLWSMGKDGLTNPTTPADKTNRDDIKNP